MMAAEVPLFFALAFADAYTIVRSRILTPGFFIPGHCCHIGVPLYRELRE
jgi:hypothetical protein